MRDSGKERPATHATLDQVFEDIAAYVRSFDQVTIGGSARDKAKLAFMDFLACVLIGSRTVEGRQLIGMHTSRFGLEPKQWRKESDSLAWAASLSFTLTALSQIYDYNDGHPRGAARKSALHPGRVVCSAALTSTLLGNRPGRELLDNLVAGYDLALGICSGPLLAPSESYAAAAIISRALGIAGDQLCKAMKIAGFLAPKSGGEDFEINHLTCGQQSAASFKAIEIALAGNSPTALNARNTSGFHFIRPNLQGAEMMDIYLKPYPCCRSIHPFIDAALQFVHDEEIRESVIVHAEVAVPRSKAGPDMKLCDPANLKALQFSFPYCIAAALMRGKLTTDELSLDNPVNPRIWEFASTIRCCISKTEDAEISLHLRDGRLVKLACDLTRLRGSRHHPLGWADLISKADHALDFEAGRGRQIAEFVRSMDMQDNISPLHAILTACWN